MEKWSCLCQEMKVMTITELSPLVRRITAGNSSVFTGPGTNTYLVGKEEITVIDPGPAMPEHIENIAKACGDVGTQYRSGIYFFDKAQEELALKTKEIYQAKLDANGFGEIVTEILPVSEEFYAEDYHQQYLAKNPNGYCGHGGCGVRFKD